MIRMYDLDEGLADIELIDGRMVFSNVTGKGVVDVIESMRRGRSDVELYHSLPQIFHGQFWAGHVNPHDEPGPDDEIVEPKSQSDLSEEELEAIQQCIEQDTAKNGVPSDADLMKEIEKMNETAPRRC
jgi:hypothetical protein